MGFPTIGFLLLPALAALGGLYCFSSLTTALVFVAILGVGTFGFLRFHEKHHRSEAYDDRLPDQRMKDAVEWWILKGGGKRNVED